MLGAPGDGVGVGNSLGNSAVPHWHCVPPPPACMPASTSPNWDVQQGVFAAFAKDGEELWLLWWHAEAHNRV